jgi:hypothetical protein
VEKVETRKSGCRASFENGLVPSRVSASEENVLINGGCYPLESSFFGIESDLSSDPDIDLARAGLSKRCSECGHEFQVFIPSCVQVCTKRS